MKNRIFLVHLRRMLTRPALYIAIVLQALLICLPLLMKSAFALTALNGFQMFCSGMFGLYYVGLLVLPAVPYAVCCSDDKNTRMLYFWCIRSGVRGYGVAYYLTTLMSGFVTTFGGVLLYFTLARWLGFPIYDQTPGTPPFVHLYQALVQGEDYRWLTVGLAVDFALGSTVVAGVAAAAASVFKNKITVYAAPMILTLLLYFLIHTEDTLSLLGLVCGNNLGQTFWSHVIWKLLVVLLYTSVFGVISVHCIEREVRRG